jgi:hypothetical protein
VRELERQLTKLAKASQQSVSAPKTDPNIDREKGFWSEYLGADVDLRYWNSGKVRITITVNSLDEYQGIKERLLAGAGSD